MNAVFVNILKVKFVDNDWQTTVCRRLIVFFQVIFHHTYSEFGNYEVAVNIRNTEEGSPLTETFELQLSSQYQINETVIIGELALTIDQPGEFTLAPHTGKVTLALY